MKLRYDYYELLALYPDLSKYGNKYFREDPDRYKRDFSIKQLSPRITTARSALLNSIKTHVINDDRNGTLHTMKSKFDAERTLKFQSLLLIDDLGRFPMPNGLRENITDLVLPNNEVHFTNYFYFAENAIVAAAKQYAKEKHLMYKQENDEKYFRAFYEERSEYWLDDIKKYAEKMKNENDKLKYFSTKLNMSEKDWIIESALMYFFTNAKMAYGGFIKELYVKYALLTSEQIAKQEVLIFQPNLIGDELGIDFLLYYKKSGDWKSVAVTSTNYKCLNRWCDICFAIGGTPKKLWRLPNVHYLKTQELNANYWVFLPKDVSQIDDIIFNNKQ